MPLPLETEAMTPEQRLAYLSGKATAALDHTMRYREWHDLRIYVAQARSWGLPVEVLYNLMRDRYHPDAPPLADLEAQPSPS